MILTLELIGLVCIVAAGWLVTPALGVFLLGVSCFGAAYGYARMKVAKK
jgi:hypothetical protein